MPNQIAFTSKEKIQLVSMYSHSFSDLIDGVERAVLDITYNQHALSSPVLSTERKAAIIEQFSRDGVELLSNASALIDAVQNEVFAAIEQSKISEQSVFDLNEAPQHLISPVQEQELISHFGGELDELLDFVVHRTRLLSGSTLSIDSGLLLHGKDRQMLIDEHGASLEGKPDYAHLISQAEQLTLITIEEQAQNNYLLAQKP